MNSPLRREEGARDLPRTVAKLAELTDHVVVRRLCSQGSPQSSQGFDESDYVRGGSDRLQAAMVTRGVEATRARVQEHLDAGASTVLVQVLGENILVPPVEDWRIAAEGLLG